MLKTASAYGLAIGALIYQGAWNASTNTPTLTSGVGTQGNYYVVSVAGNTNLDGITSWAVGDWAVFNGTVWQKLNGASSEIFAGLTITGLTGYMYANNTSPVSASSTIPVANVSGAVSNTVNVLAGGLLSGGGALTGNVTISLSNVPVANVTGLGTIATQNSNNVNLTGGTINNTTLTNVNVTSVSATFPNSYLTNSSVTIGNTIVSLGGTANSVGNLTLSNVTITGGTVNNTALSTDTIPDYLTWTSQVTNPAYAAGTLWYASDNDALTFWNGVTGNDLHLGQEVQLRVYNSTGSTIPVGSAVYVNGQHSQFPTVALAQANSSSTTNAIGLCNTAIPNNSYGYVVVLGKFTGLNTGSFNSGDTIYLSATTAGGITNVAPSSPNLVVPIGYCVYSNPSMGVVEITVPLPPIMASSISGLGTMATQNANAVVITGGTIASGNVTLTGGSENNITYTNVTISSGNSTITNENVSYINVSTAIRTQSLTGYLYGNANTGNVSASTTIPNSGLSNSTTTLGNTTLTLGSTTTSVGNLTLTNANITSVATAFPNSFFANSSVTIGNTTVSLGGTLTSTGNLTLSNVTITSGSISNVAVTSNLVTKTSNYSATASDETILGNASSGAVSITLPTSVGITGKIYIVKKIDSSANTVTIVTTSAQTIDGQSSKVLTYQYDGAQVQSDGANWFIIANTFGRNGTAGTF